MITTVIVDDEPAARKRIANLLRPCDDFRVVGQAGSVVQGLNVVRDMRPDLVFLDVEMPGANGFELVARLGKKPLIVFVSAHEGFALNAFDVEAVDYVLKPFTTSRFERALERVRQRMATAQSAALGSKMRRLMREFERERDDFLHELSFKHRGVPRTVAVDALVYLETEGNYVNLALDDGSRFLYRSAMRALCDQLDPACFLRIHRGITVHLGKVQWHRYGNNHLYQFTMSDGTVLTSGRAYREAIEDALGDGGD